MYHINIRLLYVRLSLPYEFYEMNLDFKHKHTKTHKSVQRDGHNCCQCLPYIHKIFAHSSKLQTPIGETAIQHKNVYIESSNTFVRNLEHVLRVGPNPFSND